MEDLLYIQKLNALFDSNPYVATFASLAFLVLLAFFANFVVKKILIRVVHQLFRFSRLAHDKELGHYDVVARLANIVPAMIVIMGIDLIPEMPETLAAIIRNVSSAFIVLTIAMAVSMALSVANILYTRRPDAVNKPIKGYIQVLKIAVFVVGTILIVATLIDRSPLILLSGLGAMAAVLMLVFQDTLLSLVASVQISSSDMLRVGDWIEMPNLNADGSVIDVALHTVKVQNWDKTITTIPTRRLVSDPFKNWRGMQESGGRRIKRAILIDQNSIHFLTDDEFSNLKRFSLLDEYLKGKEQEIKEWNNAQGEMAKVPVNARRMTNIGTFRAYVQNYLIFRNRIRDDMTLLVRQLAPGPTGLPIEVYCFTNTVAWAEYEGIQSDIFDHLYAILPEFGLRAFQEPSGADFKESAFFAKS